MKFDIITNDRLEKITIDSETKIVTLNNKRLQKCTKSELGYALLMLIEKIAQTNNLK